MHNPFTLEASDGLARAGHLTTMSGEQLPTPLFQPVATAGSLKTLDWRDASRLGYRHVLMNTYHLAVRPGVERIRQYGGVKPFTGWGGSVLTDSGGYQVFSLAAKRSIRESGVSFTDHIEGARHEFTPRSVLEAQLAFGVDFAMALDICTGLPASRNRVARDMQITHAWAKIQSELLPGLLGRTGAQPVNLQASEASQVGERGRAELHKGSNPPQDLNRRGAGSTSLFGIVQGGLEEDLRLESIQAISALPFGGVAVGGLAVGEPREDFLRLTAFCGPKLPTERVRYLMGVGTPADLLYAIAHGFDMFDCVQPTRMARHGTAYTRRGTVNLSQARFADDARPLDERCRCYTCRTHSRAYLRHLFTLKEHSYARLLTLHNLHFYRQLMRVCRRKIVAGTYREWWQGAYDRVSGSAE
jgi:queuine tRNA-ribosyltransferase